MPKLTKRGIRYVRTDVRPDPNYRKASLSKIAFLFEDTKINESMLPINLEICSKYLEILL